MLPGYGGYNWGVRQSGGQGFWGVVIAALGILEQVYPETKVHRLANPP